jgi:enterochelin esterase family protein
MTCGTVEENLFNNRAVAKALGDQGYGVELIENRDAHNWVGWRDTFEPHLARLLGKLWS